MSGADFLTTADTARAAQYSSDRAHPINQITDKIIDASFKIHRMYGPGLLENAYQGILVWELINNYELKIEAEKTLPIIHEGVRIETGYRIDLLVESKVIVELKAVEKLLPLHQAQVMTYMKLTNIPVGLLINFNTKLLRDGIRRIVI